jgi:hypothetical protein
MLLERGCQSVTLSPEMDRKQLEEVSSSCPAPCSIIVYSRPALMVTRVRLNRNDFAGKILRDRRGIELRARLEHGLWTLRPLDPYDWRKLRNNAIPAAHLVVDLLASSNPADEYLGRASPNDRPALFNYGRTLQ